MPAADAGSVAGFALAGYALLCACIALGSPSAALLAAGVLLPLVTALALAAAG